MKIYRSLDDGALYLEAQLDEVPPDPYNFETYEIAETVTLTVEQLAIGSGELSEVLLRAGVATLVKP